MSKQQSLENNAGQPAAEFQPGYIFEQKVEILEFIGSGAKGKVYKVKHLALDEICALKIINSDVLSDPESMARFQREIKIASQIKDDAIVAIKSSGISKDRRAYLLMEYLQGCDLQEELKIRGKLELICFQQIFQQVCWGLAAAHASGVIHRDIKPANIFLSKTNEQVSAKLIDLGLAKAVSSESAAQQKLTATGYLVGTPQYMSPEQCTDENLGPACDIYSLATVMYEALAGKPVFEADSALMVMQMHLNQTPEFPCNAKVPLELAEIILTCLSKDPKDRIYNAKELAEKIGSLDIRSLEKSEHLSSRKASRGKLSIVIACGTLILLAVLLVGFILEKQKGRQLAISEITQKERPSRTHQTNPIGKRSARALLSDAKINRKTRDFKNFPALLQESNRLLNQAKELSLADLDFDTYLESELAQVSFNREALGEGEALKRLTSLEKFLSKKKITDENRFLLNYTIGSETSDPDTGVVYLNKALSSSQGTKDSLKILRMLAAIYWKEGSKAKLEEILARMEKIEQTELQNTSRNLHHDQTLEAMIYLAALNCTEGKRAKTNEIIQQVANSISEAKSTTIASLLEALSTSCREKGWLREEELAIATAKSANLAAANFKRLKHFTTGRSVSENVEKSLSKSALESPDE